MHSRCKKWAHICTKPERIKLCPLISRKDFFVELALSDIVMTTDGCSILSGDSFFTCRDLWTRHMLYFSRQCLIRLLVLVIAISPVQIAMAIDFDAPGQTVYCQVAAVQSFDWSGDMKRDAACVTENSDHCGDISVCVAQTSFTSLRSSISLLLPPVNATRLKFITNNASMSTNYPGLLKRPPKAWHPISQIFIWLPQLFIARGMTASGIRNLVNWNKHENYQCI